MSGRISEQKVFWLVLVVLAGGLLTGIVYPRYREVVRLSEEVRCLRAEKAEKSLEVDKLRQAVLKFEGGDEAAWERAVRNRLRYHPRGTAVYTGDTDGTGN
ncbi:MAG: hypothetical protein JW909_04970 [Planctomycetes bacterium]|nr:hypothetical protein [Planctomycetota bacterium]